MKKYIGTKTIMAKPMAKREAEKVLNRSLADATGGEEGYYIEYPDGYKSWSPKETFEKAYKIADTNLDRMRIEYDEVKEREIKLASFILSEDFRGMTKPKQERLKAQAGAMLAYLDILAERIDEAKHELKEQEKAQAEIANKNNEHPVGLCYLDKAAKCDFCPGESDDCKKLILADGSCICVKPIHVQQVKEKHVKVPDEGQCCKSPANKL